MIKQHDLTMFTSELKKLRSEYHHTSCVVLKACIREDIRFLEGICMRDRQLVK
ncbi:hypothetical protein ACI2JA_12815 [Alkalihalobacillus sp. NPDC078783]